MGRAKEAMMEQEHKLALAASYLVDEEILEKCEIHDEVYSPSLFGIDEDLEKKAISDRDKADNGPIPWASDLNDRELIDLLKSAYSDHCADECGYCEKNRDD